MCSHRRSRVFSPPPPPPSKWASKSASRPPRGVAWEPGPLHSVLSWRGPFARARANIETHTVLGVAAACPRVSVVQLANCCRPDVSSPPAQSAVQQARGTLGDVCPGRPLPLQALVPQSVRTSARCVYIITTSEKKGCRNPHSIRADIIGWLSLAAYKSHTTQRGEYCCHPRTPQLGCSLQPHRERTETRQTRKSTTPHKLFKSHANNCRPLEPEQQSRRTFSKANTTRLNQTKSTTQSANVNIRTTRQRGVTDTHACLQPAESESQRK